jgi:hypothetical protein
LGMKALFVSYGGGHVEMCLPVMAALRRANPSCQLRLLALTTGAIVAQRAGESPLGYKDFADLPGSAQALCWGRQLHDGQAHPDVTDEETHAYLGFNFSEWVAECGEAAAWARWGSQGRQGFLPVNFFMALLERERPDVLVTTNSPRSERAAIIAAARLGVPSLSMLDLFALPGDPYLERNLHADRLAVLSVAARDNLVRAGVAPGRITVTGNPAFDAFVAPAARDAGTAWRELKGWRDYHVVLWAGHREPADAQPGALAGIGLGRSVQQRLQDWVYSHNGVALAVRYHPNEWHDFPPPPRHPRIHWSVPSEDPLLPVLMGADQVVVQATTVGAQAYAAGKRVAALAYSPLVLRTGMDYASLGMAQRVADIDSLVPVLENGFLAGGACRCEAHDNGRHDVSAAVRVAGEILLLAKRRTNT